MISIIPFRYKEKFGNNNHLGSSGTVCALITFKKKNFNDLSLLKDLGITLIAPETFYLAEDKHPILEHFPEIKNQYFRCFDIDSSQLAGLKKIAKKTDFIRVDSRYMRKKIDICLRQAECLT